MRGLFASFKYAIAGIWRAFKQERNLKIHALAILAVVALGLCLDIERLEWLVLLLTIALVVGLELLNTAVEALVDLVTEEYRHFAAIAKNVAAGAVLFCAFVAVIIGLIIFIPYLSNVFNK